MLLVRRKADGGAEPRPSWIRGRQGCVRGNCAEESDCVEPQHRERPGTADIDAAETSEQQGYEERGT
jgi:hypothetical protein